ncbi:MAG: hypothetical protein NXH71_11910 [Erythrobacteraceae bacterium]|jgi:hypothetical protein|nr:hypothetical protein [Erythrobacteraceae bacterium]
MPKKRAFIFSAAILFVGAILHIAVLIGGAEWVAFVGAPASIVRSAEQGTWLAPASTLAIAGLLTVLGVYALSASGSVSRLPFVRPVLALFAVIFVLRGLIIVPALLQGRVNWAAPVDLFIITSSASILALGVALCVGLWGLRDGEGRADTRA